MLGRFRAGRLATELRRAHIQSEVER